MVLRKRDHAQIIVTPFQVQRRELKQRIKITFTPLPPRIFHCPIVSQFESILLSINPPVQGPDRMLDRPSDNLTTEIADRHPTQ
jgi:hypothetical protein